MRNRNATHSLGAKLAHGYTASKCPSWYPIMKKSRSYCQTVTWLYCETVLQSSHVTAWHSWSYCPTHFWYVLCFTFLCLAGCSLADAARLLFIIGYRDRHLLAGQPWLTLHSGFVCCIVITRYTFVCVRICRSDSLAEIKFVYARSKVENGRTKLVVLGQIVHTLFISNFILWKNIKFQQLYTVIASSETLSN